MPAGHHHDRLTYLLLPGVVGACYLWLGWSAALWIGAGFWFGSLYLSPDLDTPSRPFYRWGIFRFVWWPYQWLVPHRSALSHGLVSGSILRLLYFSALVVLLYMGLRLGLDQMSTLPQVRAEVVSFLLTHHRQMLQAGGGIWLGALAHILLDTLSALFRLRL